MLGAVFITILHATDSVITKSNEVKKERVQRHALIKYVLYVYGLHITSTLYILDYAGSKKVKLIENTRENPQKAK
jgi:hypothetical protein